MWSMMRVLVDFSRGGIECRWWACLCAGALNEPVAGKEGIGFDGWLGTWGSVLGTMGWVMG